MGAPVPALLHQPRPLWSWGAATPALSLAVPRRCHQPQRWKGNPARLPAGGRLPLATGPPPPAPAGASPAHAGHRAPGAHWGAVPRRGARKASGKGHREGPAPPPAPRHPPLQLPLHTRVRTAALQACTAPSRTPASHGPPTAARLSPTGSWPPPPRFLPPLRERFPAASPLINPERCHGDAAVGRSGVRSRRGAQAHGAGLGGGGGALWVHVCGCTRMRLHTCVVAHACARRAPARRRACPCVRRRGWELSPAQGARGCRGAHTRVGTGVRALRVQGGGRGPGRAGAAGPQPGAEPADGAPGAVWLLSCDRARGCQPRWGNRGTGTA